jgi:hypothetical protein
LQTLKYIGEGHFGIRCSEEAFGSELFAEFLEKPLRGALAAACVFLGLEQFHGQLHVSAAAFLRLADEAAHDGFELRSERFLQIFVTLTRPQRLLRLFRRFRHQLRADL